jgi:citrate lyase subunit beta/citryl-CoA lyase
VPKVSTLDELQVIDGVLSALEAEYGHPDGGVQMILVSTETPLGVLNLTTFSQCRRVVSLSWGAEDLSAAIGGRRNRDENGQFLDLYKYCRIQTLLCAKAAGIQALDTVFVDILDLEGLRQESLEAAWVGYTGKITIHPAQIPVVNEVFTPSEAEIAEATELLEAFDDAQARGLMAFQFKGQMVDVPHLSRARKILESAKAVRGL